MALSFCCLFFIFPLFNNYSHYNEAVRLYKAVVTPNAGLLLYLNEPGDQLYTQIEYFIQISFGH